MKTTNLEDLRSFAWCQDQFILLGRLCHQTTNVSQHVTCQVFLQVNPSTYRPARWFWLTGTLWDESLQLAWSSKAQCKALKSNPSRQYPAFEPSPRQWVVDVLPSSLLHVSTVAANVQDHTHLLPCSTPPHFQTPTFGSPRHLPLQRPPSCVSIPCLAPWQSLFSVWASWRTPPESVGAAASGSFQVLNPHVDRAWTSQRWRRFDVQEHPHWKANRQALGASLSRASHYWFRMSVNRCHETLQWCKLVLKKIDVSSTDCPPISRSFSKLQRVSLKPNSARFTAMVLRNILPEPITLMAMYPYFILFAM